MKVKLVIVDVFEPDYQISPMKYFINENHISHWKYTPPNAPKLVESVFD